MRVGKVIGNVWATKKDLALEGLKLLVVEEIDPKENKVEKRIIAADTVGAGPGELVILVGGSSARAAINQSIPVDATVIGIIDELEIY
ncbi:MAG: EutN/CcmL family microcompartment protein [Tissierellia bacterium]|nr:EutN/CcmL family microcompartment protein [Tissierellia bacterium]